MRSFAIASLQLDLQPAHNLPRLEAELRALRRRFPWVQMAMLPELAAHGTNPSHAEPQGGPTEQHFVALARELDLWLLPGSFFQREGEAVFNVAPVISPAGEVVARHRKLYPFLPYERGITAGHTATVFDVPGVGCFGVSICYDMWFPETSRALAWLGAEIILHPGLTNTIDRGVERAIARAAAASNQCYFLDLNCAGLLGMGRSGFYGPGGEVLHESGPGYEIVPLMLDLDHVRDVRTRGWHGLGQVLKSFRDGGHSFPQTVTEAGGAASPVLTGLGPLVMPDRRQTGTGAGENDGID
jgi:predicted amidohydrolase